MPTKLTTSEPFLNQSAKMSDEVPIEIIKETQKILGKYVKKPPLTEKLLRKPPFRFLHDVITTIIKETGFLKGLYSDAELKSENVKEKNTKLAFLNKLVDAIKAITNIELAVKPAKVIAGLEPTETNLMLQAIGTALDNKVSSTKYVQEIKNTDNKSKQKSKKAEKNEKTEKVTKITKSNETLLSNRSSKDSVERKKTKTTEASAINKSKTRDSSEQRDKTKLKKSSTPKDSKKEATKHKEKPKVPKEIVPEIIDKDETIIDTQQLDNSPKTPHKDNTTASLDNVLAEEKFPENESPKSNAEANEKLKNEEISAQLDEQKISEDIPIQIEQKSSNKERPKSARPKSGITKKENIPLSNNIVNQNEINQIQNSKDLLRPPSVRPPSARPGAPRLRPESALPQEEIIPMGKINVIVENFGNNEDEEETVVIQTKPSEEPIEFQPAIDLDISGEKGQLVEQILEQISEQDMMEKPKIKTDIEWEGYKDAVHKEIEPLRTSVQALTKTATPLSKLISYLHEDIETMHNELNMWKTMKRKTLEEIAKQERIKEESCKPLQIQLEDIENSLKKQEEEILDIRSSILRNAGQIKQKINLQLGN